MAAGMRGWTYKEGSERREEPYGGGELFVQPDEQGSLMMQLLGAPLEFKKGAPGEFTEEWMNDVSEISNRKSIRILKSDLQGNVDIVFQKYGDQSQWWISNDGQIVYLVMEWFDRVKSEGVSKDEYLDYSYFTIHKSTDAGRHFSQLPWPEHEPINHPVFKQNGQDGYLLGGGPSIWRTTDGGLTWVEINAPKEILATGTGEDARARYINRTAQFEAFDLDQIGTLSVAAFIQDRLGYKDTTLIYQLPWDETITDMQALKPIVLPEMRVEDIKRAPEGGLYLLTKTHDFSTLYPNSEEVDYGFMHLQQDKIVTQTIFGRPLRLITLYQGQDNMLVASGVETKTMSLSDRNFISFDNGLNWTLSKGPSNAAAYIDEKTNKAWMYKGFSYYYKHIKP